MLTGDRVKALALPLPGHSARIAALALRDRSLTKWRAEEPCIGEKPEGDLRIRVWSIQKPSVYIGSILSNQSRFQRVGGSLVCSF
jgi:hypothetical protein